LCSFFFCSLLYPLHNDSELTQTLNYFRFWTWERFFRTQKKKFPKTQFNPPFLWFFSPSCIIHNSILYNSHHHIIYSPITHHLHHQVFTSIHQQVIFPKIIIKHSPQQRSKISSLSNFSILDEQSITPS